MPGATIRSREGNVHRLAIDLMSANNSCAVVELLEQQLRTVFSADQSVLVLFDSVPGYRSAEGRFLRVVDRDDSAIASFKTFLQSSAPRCGRVRDAQKNFLFGSEDLEIGSVALVPLGEKSASGFLAIGSRNADHFHPGKSIDFLSRLGELIVTALNSKTS